MSEYQQSTYESCAIGAEATDELLPGCPRVRKDDDPPDEFPRSLDLLFTNAARLVCAQAHAVDVLQRLSRVHLHKLSDVSPEERREAEGRLARGWK